jgi:hypothetical protein
LETHELSVLLSRREAEACSVAKMVAKASPIYKESRKRSAEIAAETQESDEEFVTVRCVVW